MTGGGTGVIGVMTGGGCGAGVGAGAGGVTSWGAAGCGAGAAGGAGVGSGGSGAGASSGVGLRRGLGRDGVAPSRQLGRAAIRPRGLGRHQWLADGDGAREGGAGHAHRERRGALLQRAEHRGAGVLDELAIVVAHDLGRPIGSWRRGDEHGPPTTRRASPEIPPTERSAVAICGDFLARAVRGLSGVECADHSVVAGRVRRCPVRLGLWRGKDSNLRRQCQRVYSASPLTAREPRRAVSECSDQAAIASLRGRPRSTWSPTGATARRAAAAPRAATRASSACGSRSGGCARGSR